MFSLIIPCTEIDDTLSSLLLDILRDFETQIFKVRDFKMVQLNSTSARFRDANFKFREIERLSLKERGTMLCNVIPGKVKNYQIEERSSQF